MALNNRNLSHSSGALKSKIQVLARLTPSGGSEGEFILPSVAAAILGILRLLIASDPDGAW